MKEEDPLRGAYSFSAYKKNIKHLFNEGLKDSMNWKVGQKWISKEVFERQRNNHLTSLLCAMMVHMNFPKLME